MRKYFSYGHGSINQPTILFAQSGGGTAGIYIGKGLQNEGIADFALKNVQDNILSLNVHRGNVAMLCNGTFTQVQNTIQAWSKGDCLSSYASQNISSPSYFTTLSRNSTIAKNATLSTNLTSIYTARSFYRNWARGDCTTVQVESGDSCASLAAGCGISAVDFTEYSSASDLCSTLQPGQHVCCSSGTLPDFAPQPNADGSCATYTVVSGDSCSAIAATYSLTLDELNDYNKDTWGWGGCDDLLIGNIICLSSGTAPMPPLKQTPCATLILVFLMPAAIYGVSVASRPTEDCFFTGSASVSNAEPGVCTNTVGYISNAEINEIMGNASRVTTSYVDESSNSNILVYDGTQWVAYMDSTIKSECVGFYQGLEMGGGTLWASDLSEYNSAPYPSTSWTNFVELAGIGTDPYAEGNRTGNWTTLTCSDPSVTDLKDLTSEERWYKMDSPNAWADAVDVWLKVDQPAKSLTFTESISNTLHAPEMAACGGYKDTSNCVQTYTCAGVIGDGTGLAGYEIWNSMVIVHELDQPHTNPYCVSLDRVEPTVVSVASYESNYGGIELLYMIVSPGAVIKLFSSIYELAFEHLIARGFIHITTPSLIDYQVPGDDDYFELAYFGGRTARLTQTGELHLGQALSAGLERVFEVHPVFRREKDSSPRHLTEVVSVGSEAKRILRDKVGFDTDDQSDFSREEENAIALYLANPDSAVNNTQPTDVFAITHYPKHLRPYNVQSSSEDQQLTNSFDIILRDQELASGFQAINDYHALCSAMEARNPPFNLADPMWQPFLSAYKPGAPLHGGFGMGLNRFLQSFLGLSHIHETVLFPRDATRLAP
ncbi:hypothetical protein ZTR_09196 [Talaromyces verruculosus]|nr:hypothetical protein ZTR_09196 [Talaromyces verruculosus]